MGVRSLDSRPTHKNSKINSLHRFRPTNETKTAAHPDLLKIWIERKHVTPPYMSSTCTAKHQELEKGDAVVLASDGFQAAASLCGKFNDEERMELLLDLACAESQGRGQNLSAWKSRIGH